MRFVVPAPDRGEMVEARILEASLYDVARITASGQNVAAKVAAALKKAWETPEDSA